MIVLLSIHRSPSFILASEFIALKQDLKEWNAEVFGNFNGQKNSFMEEMQILEPEEEDGALFEEIFLRKKKSRVDDLERVLLMEEISQRQKSKALWL